jgi:hypothetical protein
VILLTHKVAGVMEPESIDLMVIFGVMEPESIDLMVIFEQRQYDDSRNAYRRLHRVTSKIKLRAIFWCE